jgi:hypothetical protein
MNPNTESIPQLVFARRRCRKCDWPSVGICIGGLGKGVHRYQCRSCGSKHTYKRKNQLIPFIFKLTFYAMLFKRPVAKRRHRITTLGVLALKGIDMPEIRELIVRMAGLY